jgi:hypothetical protein
LSDAKHRPSIERAALVVWALADRFRDARGYVDESETQLADMVPFTVDRHLLGALEAMGVWVTSEPGVRGRSAHRVPGPLLRKYDAEAPVEESDSVGADPHGDDTAVAVGIETESVGADADSVGIAVGVAVGVETDSVGVSVGADPHTPPLPLLPPESPETPPSPTTSPTASRASNTPIDVGDGGGVHVGLSKEEEAARQVIAIALAEPNAPNLWRSSAENGVAIVARMLLAGHDAVELVLALTRSDWASGTITERALIRGLGRHGQDTLARLEKSRIRALFVGPEPKPESGTGFLAAFRPKEPVTLNGPITLEQAMERMFKGVERVIDTTESNAPDGPVTKAIRTGTRDRTRDAGDG